MPGRTSTNTPKFIILVAVPINVSPALYLAYEVVDDPLLRPVPPHRSQLQHIHGLCRPHLSWLPYAVLSNGSPLPPGPITSRIFSGSMFIVIIFGAVDERSTRGAGIAASIMSSISIRPFFACSRGLCQDLPCDPSRFVGPSVEQ